MTSTVTQIVSFPMQEETGFKEYTSVMKNSTKGLRNQMLGVGVERSEARCWILQWDPTKKSAVPDVRKILQPATTGPIQNVHVVFNESLTPSLAAPVTEIIVAHTKPGQDLITFGEIINVALRSTAQQPGCLGTTWGYTEEDKGMAILVIGWATVEAHRRYTRTEVFKITTLPFFQGLTESSSDHFKFQHK